jgi:hypothetical protein
MGNFSTFRDGEEAVRWVSGQINWLAAMAAKSTGGNCTSAAGAGPAAAVAASDPGGTFTLAGFTAAVPGPGREDDGLDRASAKVSGLWSVYIRKGRPSSMNLKCLMPLTQAKSSLSKAEYAI